MFAPRYFARRYFPGRYFPPVVGAVVETGTPAPTWRGVGRPDVARGQQRGDVLRGSPRAETMRPRR
jgi:hypothetical protein